MLADCRLAVIHKQDVPSQRDGVLLFVGREVLPAENVPDQRLLSIDRGDQPVTVRRWKEGDFVQHGELLAQLDDRFFRDDWAIKQAKLASAQADLSASERTRDEAKTRYERQVKLHRLGKIATSEEEVQTAKLNWDRYHFEAIGKLQAVALARAELRRPRRCWPSTRCAARRQASSRPFTSKPARRQGAGSGGRDPPTGSAAR